MAVTAFELMVEKTLSSGKPLLFLATNHSGVSWTSEEELLDLGSANPLNEILSGAYVAIPFSKLIDDLITLQSDPTVRTIPSFLSAQEKKIIELLRRKKLKQVTLLYDEKCETIYRAQITTTEIINVAQSVRSIISAIRSKEYKSIHITDINSNNHFIEREEVIKL